jgi:hypothetical protein
MLKRFRAWIKRRKPRPSTPEDQEAQQEANRIQDDRETARIEERQGDRNILGR